MAVALPVFYSSTHSTISDTTGVFGNGVRVDLMSPNDFILKKNLGLNVVKIGSERHVKKGGPVRRGPE
jgi:hypothetical protein